IDRESDHLRGKSTNLKSSNFSGIVGDYISYQNGYVQEDCELWQSEGSLDCGVYMLKT
ncbi:hypothetical protein EJB05_43246, partial [Eragrostis curvula]